ncbi:MAG: hypothetical protein O2819_01395 [Planctomycetota bacterium]|nr:hypothetical protein [Planctomycetota bacterium]MDA1105004.1 hypothetical protein [Planctomycetota bacterium]
MDFTPGTTVTLAVTKVPAKVSHIKTLQRLMRMQPDIQRGLSKVAKARHRKNREQPRGGRIWVARIRATKLIRVAEGETFTLFVTPQIVPDLRAVSHYLKAA